MWYLTLVPDLSLRTICPVADLTHLLLRPFEMWFQRRPAFFIVVVLQFGTLFQAPICNANHQTALEHECHTALTYFHRLQFCI